MEEKIEPMWLEVIQLSWRDLFHFRQVPQLNEFAQGAAAIHPRRLRSLHFVKNDGNTNWTYPRLVGARGGV
jgi:hypothetical protein